MMTAVHSSKDKKGLIKNKQETLDHNIRSQV